MGVLYKGSIEVLSLTSCRAATDGRTRSRRNAIALKREREEEIKKKKREYPRDKRILPIHYSSSAVHARGVPNTSCSYSGVLSGEMAAGIHSVFGQV